jgi:hypothetical protein
MKKLSTAVLAAALLVSASACAAPAPQLTTEQTCERIRIVGSDSSASAGKTGMIILGNRLRPILAGASDDLKPSVQAILDYTDESAKENPDAEKLAGMQEGYQQAGATFSRLCQ